MANVAQIVETGEIIDASDFTREEFEDLKEYNKEVDPPYLICVGCESKLIAKGGNKKVAHFAHAVNNRTTENCEWHKDKDPRSDRHKILEKRIRDDLKKKKYDIRREVRLPYENTIRKGDLGCKLPDGTQYSIEIQLSHQKPKTYEQRLEGYKNAGFDSTVWLTRGNDPYIQGRLPYVYFCDESGSEIGLSQIDSRLESGDLFHVSGTVPTDQGVNRFSFELIEFLELYLDKKIVYRSCDYESKLHWHNEKKCAGFLKDREDRKKKEEEERRIAEQWRIEEEKRREERRIEREKQEALEALEREKQEAIEANKKKRQLERQEKEKRRIQEEEERRIQEAEELKQRLEEERDEFEGCMELPDSYGWGPEWGMDCECETEYIQKREKPGGNWQFYLYCPSCGYNSNRLFMTESDLSLYGDPLKMRIIA